ncbi:MAG TPA: collagenase [Bacillota bacterium]|nr:collagenase [Bacillota bacterium]
MKRKFSLTHSIVRGIIATAICIVFVFSASGWQKSDTFAGFPTVEVRLNGNVIQTKVPAIDVKGHIMIPRELIEEILGVSIQEINDSSTDPSADVSIDLSALEELQKELASAQEQLSKYALQATSEGLMPIPSKPVKLDCPYVLLSLGVSPNCSFVDKFGKGGLLGGSMTFIYDNMPKYIDSVRGRDSILVYDVDHEVGFDILKKAPASINQIIPFTPEELSQYAPPYIWFRLDTWGRQRGIAVVGGTEDVQGDIAALANLVASGKVPIDRPVTPQVDTYAMAAKPLDPSAIPEQPTVVSSEHFEVVTHHSCVDDGPIMLKWAEETMDKLVPVFPDALETVPYVSISVTVPSGKLQYGTAFAHTASNPPKITFIAPSLAAKENPYYDKDWYIGNIAHEFMHCLYEKYSLAATGKSVSNRDVPMWFNEGVGEYARLIVLGESRFDAKQAEQYNPAIQKIIDEGLSSVDAYSGGAWALRYMNSEYGHDKIVSLMKSKEFSFSDAMKKELGVTLTEFEKGLKEWLKKR